MHNESRPLTQPANTAVLTQVFAPMILEAHGRGLRTTSAGDTLALTLHDAAQHGALLTEEALAVAVKAELGLRYGCAVTQVAPIGTTGVLLAVGFDADVLAARRADPVDLLILGEGITFPQRVYLRWWRQVVQRMLTVLTWPHLDWDQRAVHLADTVTWFQRASRESWLFATPERLLLRHVCAANIELCVRAARGDRP
jgi:hypothetical protein